MQAFLNLQRELKSVILLGKLLQCSATLRAKKCNSQCRVLFVIRIICVIYVIDIAVSAVAGQSRHRSAVCSAVVDVAAC